MSLTEEQLRERGIVRSVGEMVAEAGEMVALSVGSMPVGRRREEPWRELTDAEAGILKRGGLDLSGPSEGRQLARTAAKYAAILASSLTITEAAALLGVSESRIRQRIGERSLYGVRARRQWRLPRFQFSGYEEVPGVGGIIRRMPEDIHPVSAENFFTLPNPDLYLDEEEEQPASPREWLLSGGSPETVVPLAEEL